MMIDTINESDRKLIAVLQQDGRISNQDLAAATNLSPSACWRKVKAMEESGIIQGYGARLDPQACGLDFHAIIHVGMVRNADADLGELHRKLTMRPEVLDCFATTGEADLHIRVRCSDLEAYNKFLENFLYKIDGIGTVRTNVVLRELKHDPVLTL